MDCCITCILLDNEYFEISLIYWSNHIYLHELKKSEYTVVKDTPHPWYH